MPRPLLHRLAAAAVVAALLSPLAIGALAPASAQAPAAELGVAAGAQAPAIEGTTQTGAAADFASLKGPNGLVIAFVRSADWCPFCKQQLKDLNGVAADLEKRGFKLVALSYDPVETLAKFSAKEKLGYTLVSDEDSSVIDAFGLRNMDVAKNKRMNGIPHPAIYFIGADNEILAKLYEDDYRKRPPAELVVETVDKLAAAG